MITITRRQAWQLRALMRRAFGDFRGLGPALGFIVDAEALPVKAVSADAAVEYCVPGDAHSETLWRLFSLLADYEGKYKITARLSADILAATLASIRQLRGLGVGRSAGSHLAPGVAFSGTQPPLPRSLSIF